MAVHFLSENFYVRVQEQLYEQELPREQVPRHEENPRIRPTFPDDKERIASVIERSLCVSSQQTKNYLELAKALKISPLKNSTCYLPLFWGKIYNKHSATCTPRYLRPIPPSLIAKGDFSRVFKTTDNDPSAPLPHPYVVLKLANSEESELVMRNQECRMVELARAKSRFVLPLLTLFHCPVKKDPSNPSAPPSYQTLVFPYIDTTLSALLKTANNPLFFDIFQQLLQFLSDMKQAHIVHADFKLGNILYGKINPEDPKASPQVWVIDFGLSFLEREEKDFAVQTFDVRSPEVYLTILEAFSPSMDMWSLGCILFETVTKVSLFATMPDNKNEVSANGNCFSGAFVSSFFFALQQIHPKEEFLRFFSWFQAYRYIPKFILWQKLLDELLKPKPVPDRPNPLKQFDDKANKLFPPPQAKALGTILRGCFRLIPEERISPKEALEILQKSLVVPV